MGVKFWPTLRTSLYLGTDTKFTSNVAYVFQEKVTRVETRQNVRVNATVSLPFSDAAAEAAQTGDVGRMGSESDVRHAQDQQLSVIAYQY